MTASEHLPQLPPHWEQEVVLLTLVRAPSLSLPCCPVLAPSYVMGLACLRELEALAGAHARISPLRGSLRMTVYETDREVSTVAVGSGFHQFRLSIP
jgi:hypothetical protein